MIETLVSFVVLVMVLAALYGVVLFSSELYMRSVDTSRLQQQFYREIYKTSGRNEDFIKVTSYEAGSGVHGNDYSPNHAGLVLSLDKEKTKPENYGDDDNIYINLNLIAADTYVCKQSETDKNTIMPKAILFKPETNTP